MRERNPELYIASCVLQMARNEMAPQVFFENDDATISPAGVNYYVAEEFVCRCFTGRLILEAGDGHCQNAVLSFNRVCSNACYYH